MKPILRTVILTALTVAPAAAQNWVVGLEGNDRTGYAHLTGYHRIPIATGEQVVLSATGSYLWYDTGSTERPVDVRSPGIGVAAMYRWYSARYDFSVGPGYEVRRTTRNAPDGDTTETEQGALALGELAYRPNERITASASARYSGANQWLLAGGNVVAQLSPSLRVGPEFIRQGNDEVTVTQIGGIAAIPQGDSWLYFRAGQATIDSRGRPSETKPYFSVGIGTAF